MSRYNLRDTIGRKADNAQRQQERVGITQSKKPAGRKNFVGKLAWATDKKIERSDPTAVSEIWNLFEQTPPQAGSRFSNLNILERDAAGELTPAAANAGKLLEKGCEWMRNSLKRALRKSEELNRAAR